MKKSLHLIRQKYSALLHPILCIFLLFFASACGDTDYSSGDNRSSESGSISFSVEWQGAPTVRGAAGSNVTRVLDCTLTGVSTVEAEVYDPSGNSIASGGPWNCAAHSGRIDNVPVGLDRTVAIMGKNQWGNIIYLADKTGIDVATDQTNYVGEIIVYPMVGGDDQYESNNYLSSAYDLSSNENTWLSTIDGYGVQADDDWYMINVTSGYERVIVDLRFTHADGNIDVELLDVYGNSVVWSVSSTDNEYIDYIVSAPGTYYIRVYQNNDGNTYDLWWDDSIVGVADDNYEENDTLATAYDLSNNEYTWLSDIDGYGVQADDDYYKIYVTSGYERVIVELEFTHADGDIDMALYNSSGTLLVGSYSSTDNESIDHIVSAGGTYYYIRVYYGNQDNTYNFWWDDYAP